MMAVASQIIPLILAGGAGTRLWPLSRGQAPKQFLRLAGGQTLLQQTLARCAGGPFHSRAIIVGAEPNRAQLLGAIQSNDVDADILLEPSRRNSCVAITVGALRAMERQPDALVLTLAADHYIPDSHKFQTAVIAAAPAAESGKLVTFGVKPTSPATSYGYILPGEAFRKSAVAHVKRFVEKPDLETAETHLSEGYLWNSGNFLFKAKDFIEEVQQNAPDVLAAAEGALKDALRDTDFIRLAPGPFSTSPVISVDYAVMEKTRNACVLPVDYEWRDVGSWDAVAQTLPVDFAQNAIVGRAIVHEGHNVTVHSEDLLTTVIGCENIVVVTTRDAVLVLQKGQGENVKTVVDQMMRDGFSEANHFTVEESR